MNGQNMEPAAEDLLRSGKAANDLSSVPPLYSIAISLKRIADVLEGNEAKYGIAMLISDLAQSVAEISRR